jgi:hypothetical protein
VSGRTVAPPNKGMKLTRPGGGETVLEPCSLSPVLGGPRVSERWIENARRRSIS